MLAGPDFSQLVAGPHPHDLPALASLAPVLSGHSLLGARLRLCLASAALGPQTLPTQHSKQTSTTVRHDHYGGSKYMRAMRAY